MSIVRNHIVLTQKEIRINIFINSNQGMVNQYLTKLFLSYKIHTLQKVDINVLES